MSSSPTASVIAPSTATVTMPSSQDTAKFAGAFFLLAGMAEKFHLLAYGLALVLIFIGVKMLIVDFYKIPVAISLGVVAALIVSAMAFSLIIKPKPKKAAIGEDYIIEDKHS